MKFFVMGPEDIGRPGYWREMHINPLKTWRHPEYADHKYFLATTGFVCFNRNTNFWFKVEK